MTLTRRKFTQVASVWAAATAVGRAWAADTLRIGYVSPQTGPLAAFGEADKWVVDQMRLALMNGNSVGGKDNVAAPKIPLRGSMRLI